MSLKLLICGDIKGKFDDLYKKIDVIEKKSGKFDTLFCIGDAFGDSYSSIISYIDGKSYSPIETYIISQLPSELNSIIDVNGSEICKNITYLGKKGVIKFQNKLKIGFLNGTEVTNEEVKNLSHQLMCTNIGYTGIDILFTLLWPSGIEKLGKELPSGENSVKWGNELISALAVLVKPRYHFTAGRDLYYERQPYKNGNSLSKPKHATRFIGLSSYKNKANDKYLYALQLQPMELMVPEDLLKIPADCTENPFLEIKTDLILSSTSQQFFYDPSLLKRKAESEGEHSEKKKQRTNSTDGCWFCLGNPQVEKHLIVHVGNEVYVAMPRGALSDEHLMILTVGHFQSFVTVPAEVRKEVRRAMKTIVKYFSTKDKDVVFFERNFKTNHFQMQVVPVDRDKLETCRVLFTEMGSSPSGPGENFREIPSRAKLVEIVNPNVPYFYVEFSDESKFFGSIPRDRLSSFDLQFGRLVLSHLKVLNCPHKVDWRKCIEDKSIERKMVKKMQNSLSKFFEI